MKLTRTLGVLVAVGAGFGAQAQSLLNVPEDSPRAVAMQRIGLTDITITYHRPLIKGRKIWGALVPYDQVWRAGANENTTIEFSTPVTVEGQPLAKGIYGLHTIPGTDSWTMIFSKNSGSWGSFTYNKDEDALRVSVKPQPGEFHEALAYDFDDVKPDSTVASLRWEKMAVPFRIGADVKATTLESFRNELRSGKQYTWITWDEAASYCLANKINLDEAIKWADQSIQYEPRFENQMTKARLLSAANRESEATAARAKAIDGGSVAQLYTFARQLQIQEKKQAEAMDVFRILVKRGPDTLQGHLAQGRLASAAGDFDTASKQVKIAQAMPGISDAQKQALTPLIKRLDAKDDINK